jgi:asparagine synthase (glutamine-hydrolysing)
LTHLPLCHKNRGAYNLHEAMSGIVGIINGDGAPLDTELLQRMTEALDFRGPDAQQVWHQGHVGFGHTMLRTTLEAQHEIQPHTLEGRVWITADARIDARDDLTRKLRAQGQEIPPGTTDPEFILYAYRVWGTDCVHHLLGDFAFAIWDADHRRLFCARDHFGVKPFYYTCKSKLLIFSNTLKVLLQHPAVTTEINEQFIGDFLLFGINYDFSITAFADVQRLPPAHYLTFSQRGLGLHRYWNLTDQTELQYQRADEYVERFKELLKVAVTDRLRTNHVSVFMSGGLDSTTLAAIAKESLRQQYTDFGLRANCVVYDHLIPDQERHYAGLAAKSLNLPIEFLAADDYAPFESEDTPALCRPEPYINTHLSVFLDLVRQTAAHSRVALTGYDGDALLSERPQPYFHYLLQKRQLVRLLHSLGQYVQVAKEPPPVGFRNWLQRWRGRQRPPLTYPVWLNTDFARRVDLPARWQKINAAQAVRGLRPNAWHTLNLPNLREILDQYDPGLHYVPLEVRHPLLDLRLIDYLWSIPPVPWLIRKHLLKTVTDGILPDEIRYRPKTPVIGSPILEQLQGSSSTWLDNFQPLSMLLRYVECSAIPPLANEHDIGQIWLNTRPFSLNRWLRSLHLKEN